MSCQNSSINWTNLFLFIMFCLQTVKFVKSGIPLKRAVIVYCGQVRIIYLYMFSEGIILVRLKVQELTFSQESCCIPETKTC